MIRFLDIVLSLFGLLFLSPVMLILLVAGIFDTGSPVFRQIRLGRDQQKFMLVKFRTMRKEAESVASHLADASLITPFGHFLRRTKLDELPQLWNVLIGNMSIVGPRPALFNQYDLIELRTSKGVHHLSPGLTGWAQVNGRDDLSIAKKVKFDTEYLKKKSFIFDLKILSLTILKIIRREGIQH